MVQLVHQKKWDKGAGTPLPHSTNTNGPGMVSPIQAPSGSPVKHQALLSGIDTLVLTAGGVSAPSGWLLEQVSIWEQYQSEYEFGEEYICIELNGKWFQLYPYGSKQYKFQLRNPEIGFIKLWNPNKWSSGVAGKQQVYLQLTSKFIHSVSINELNEKVKEICSLFFEDMVGIEVLISRVDLHTDITNGDSMLTYEEVSNAITRSKVRNQYFENDIETISEEDIDFLEKLSSFPPTYNKGGQKLIEEGLLQKLLNVYHNQVSIGANNIVRKRNLETAYFGKFGSDIWGKVYNKTSEVKTKLDNDTPQLWSDNGWNGTDIVVRTEFSMRRGFLKQIDNGSYVSLISFISNMDKVWDYLTNSWLRFVEEVKENNSTWSKITSFWKMVQSSFTEVRYSVIRKKNYKGRIVQLYQQGIGCIKQMISIGMVNNEDYGFVVSTKQALETTLLQSIELGEYYKRRQILGLA